MSDEGDVMRSEPVGLEWSIKLSFLRYVGGAGGQASVTHGGTMTAPNVFCFSPLADAEIDESMCFMGDVRFSAHAGMLFVRIANPRLVRTDESWTMIVDDPYDTSGEGTLLPLVTCTLTEDTREPGIRAWVGRDVVLTPEGVELFNEVYAVGESFEDFRVTLPVLG